MTRGRSLAVAAALVTAMVSWGSAAAPSGVDRLEKAAPRPPAASSGGMSRANLLDRRPPRVGGLQIRDSGGRFVGLVTNLNPEGAQVIRRNGDDLLVFMVQRSGISEFSPVYFLYENGDCSGPALMIDRFMMQDAGLAIGLAYKLGTTGYYPVPPYVTRTLSSTMTFPLPEDGCNSSGGAFRPPDQCCYRVDEFSYSVGEVGTVDFGSLEGPFHVEGL